MGTRFSGNLLMAAAAVSVATAILVLPASAQPASESVKTDAVKADGALVETGEGLRIDWTRGVLTMTGLGFSPDRGTLSQRRALAHQTALTDGTRRLYEAVNQLRVTGNAFVRDLTAVDQSLREALHARIAATPAKTVTPWPDGSVELKLELPLWGDDSLAALIASATPESLMVRPLGLKNGLMARSVELSASGAPEAAGEPSALVVDGRGTGAQPALAIALKDAAGTVLYRGPVTYFHASESLAEVAGQKPLQLKARRAVGVTRADLTLTAEEAKRFREARESQPGLAVVVML